MKKHYLAKYSPFWSINQYDFFSINISSEAGLTGMTAKSVFNREINTAVPKH